MKPSSALASLALVIPASAHSRITNLVIDGVSYAGFDAKSTSNPPLLAAWSTTASDDGWVGTESYGRPNIACHKNARTGAGHAPVPAGGTVSLQWQGWPESHHGPVVTHLAWCGSARGSCEGLEEAAALSFFAIDAVGLVDQDVNATEFATAPGLWASDVLIQNNASWVVQIPRDIAPGYYVLRHEIIALHFARYPGQGAQHYPQCVNIQVTGGGGDMPKGTKATDLYEAAEEGLIYDISRSPLPPYKIPGPTVYSGAKTFVAQTAARVLSSATAIPGFPEATGGSRSAAMMKEEDVEKEDCLGHQDRRPPKHLRRGRDGGRAGVGRYHVLVPGSRGEARQPRN